MHDIETQLVLRMEFRGCGDSTLGCGNGVYHLLCALVVT